ncbi:D-3-phosphoglycerate dehydrogenase [Halohasta litchfieldiae]|jgi:Phosphoglycerate dehydrogenase and related dehydrogenases|uniref:D-3-phosphoglycerate dehydrogenase n=1 Tax=Halohasta litchfieldiae TaxID=1073996 RepID=A0A1H6VQX1_9EURY|nr:2-hydroxyacid dehydrogenase [Halohasta litchfieldiae]ATW89392.1 D-3-phosphoglycerate dehydrogenase [Halohasta litchfieldiae]SEJ05474.1 D-3-phosphoglycerate dehydrogenase [Halohasta litchfieldiae]
MRRVTLGSGHASTAEASPTARWSFVATGPSSSIMKILVTANLSSAALSRLEDDYGFDVEYVPIGDRESRLPESEFIDHLEGVEILIVGYEGVSENVLTQAEDLEIIACARGGPDANVDIAAATERGIPVLYAPGRNAVSVADFTWGLILAAGRQIARAHHLLHTGTYTGDPISDAAGGGEREDVTWGVAKDSPFANLKGPELTGKTVGIVGMGAIGQAVAARAQGFGVDLLGYDPYIDADEMADHDVTKGDLDELLEKSDVVTVHAPVTDSTRGLFGTEEFAAMKDSAFFINTARGALIDQDALVKALQNDELQGAALDVYDKEPLPDDHPLLDLDRVVTTPHLAGAANEVVDRHSKMIVDDIDALLNGREPTHVADKSVVDDFGLTADN